MESRILVAYVSVYGSTKEVAGVVANTLRENGFAVELRTLREVRDLAGYSGVVIGAPLYILRWHADAHHFISRFQGELARIPVAVFAGGPFGAGDDAEWGEVRKQMRNELAKHPGFSPASVEIVGGKYDPQRLRLPWSLLPALKQVPANDLRDWGAIRAWAAGLKGSIGVPAVQSVVTG